jgi:hypothetical protein
MNQLTTRCETSPPAPLTPTGHTILRTYLSRLEEFPGLAKSSISAQLAPTLADKQWLSARLGALRDSLKPEGASNAAAAAISRMFMSFASVSRMDASMAARTAVAFAEQVKYLPLWAIQAGCDEWAGKDEPFPPSAGQLKAACERAVQVVRDEAGQIRKVLEAEVYTPNARTAKARAVISGGFKNLRQELSRHGRLTPRSARHQTDVATE